ncbi:hypothetical protein [Protaetiibacter larvae]|uniref:Uncharacterized protein n=1 Tax=Protaetiibacter larvae TaxID=2592654 RepID=A0A5C1YA95_9MICO|nr:hypothetical protein [Protaetiibacter larvae]QEO09797.1 hypothetical protein FLP23_07140 [Protaetiibacter larvae]
MSAERPQGPKQGIYLDAALAAVGERVEERIDRVVERRRRRTRALVAALAGTTLLGGAVTAAALTVGAQDAPAPSYHLESVRCVEGADDSGSSYFAVRYELADSDRGRVDAEALCLGARDRLVAAPELADASPARLLALAEQLIDAASTASAGAADAGSAGATVDAHPRSASFGVLSDPGYTPPTLATCGVDETRTVLFDSGLHAVCSRGESDE